MDGEEIYSEEITSSGKIAHTYTIPVQEPGDHIFKTYATMEVSNMTVTSNTLTLGMLFYNDKIVDTYILSTFEQTEATQGDIITIPYLVYQSNSETSEIKLNIYNEDGSMYSTKIIEVDKTAQTWITQDYPAGNIIFEIAAKSNLNEDRIKQFNVTVTASEFTLTPVLANLALEFSAAGRSNNEKNPEQWSYGQGENGIHATFERFAWSVADGWVESDSGETILRFLPKNRMIIPYQPFATDKRTTGYTIEIEMATHNVRDYDATVISCMDNGRGFAVKSQSVVFKSEQSENIIMQFKEDDRVRITIVIEPQTLNRFIKLYINGILCGVQQYTENDNFKQANPQNIIIGSDDSGLDLYKLRFYNKNLSDVEQLNNFICDRSTIGERIEVKDRNNIYDTSGNLTIASLPPSIPYLVMQCPELPQYKGDKKSDMGMYFVDQLRPDRSFSASGCQFDVQGTSSAGYPIKNFKIKFKKGITYDDGTTADGYPIIEGSLISECLCLKADYASSEQANNVMLVDYYDELIRDYFLTPPQEGDARIRTGITGRPIVLFWHNTATGEIKFQGQYNMNNDKSNENLFGFDRDKYPKLECWEFSNNTSDRTLFKKSEWLEEIYDKEKDKMVPAWMSDFEARFPDLDDPYNDYTQFKRFCDFIVSTDRNKATDAVFDTPVTYEGVEYNYDSAEYRLAKFKNEFTNYAFLDPFIFYYIFTETFLMIDSRAKNMFLTTFDGEHWFPIPYDFDTAIGINNEGQLVFDYDLEDTDQVGNENVFNGQESVLWINIRDAYQARIFAMYDKLRQSDKFSYDVISKKMHEHQSVWPEAIWNEDANVKYLDIYLTEKEEYFDMCQGDKSTQRDWWLFNAFKYRDSKYQCGDSDEIMASFRAYAPGDMTVTPYQHLWPRVDYTDTYPVTQRSKRNEPNLLKLPENFNLTDTEIFLRSADRIASFGDLSVYMADTVKLASAVKLQEVILGSSAEGYENQKLGSVELGNNRLISYLNVENCVNLVSPINVSECYNLDTVKAKGSKLSSITFPVGGHLETLELPGTFTNLTLRNQHNITTFDMDSYENLNTLWIDDTPNLPIQDIILNSPKLDRVRLVNTTWDVDDEETLREIFEKLKTCGGMDANGNNTADGKAVVTGFVNIDSISDDFISELNNYFMELIVVVAGVPRFFVRYHNYNNELLYKMPATIGMDAIDPITANIIQTPTLPPTGNTRYAYREWTDLPKNLQGPKIIIALYDEEYRVRFFNGNDTVLNSQWIPAGMGAIDPVLQESIIPSKPSTVEYYYEYRSWDKAFDNIIEPIDIYPIFDAYVQKYQVYFVDNVGNILQETTEYYGTIASYQKDSNLIKKIVGGEESEYYNFIYWTEDPKTNEPVDFETSRVQGTSYYYPVFEFDGYIEDDWNTIVQNVAIGNADVYGLCGRVKTPISYVYNNVTYEDEVEFEIIDTNHDTLVNGGTAALTFSGMISLKMPMSLKNNSWTDDDGKTESSLTAGGWRHTLLRQWLNGEEFRGNLPEALKLGIKQVTKLSDRGHPDYHDSNGPSLDITEDWIFVPSATELNVTNLDHYTMPQQGSPYKIFTDNASRAKGTTYWLRSTAGQSSYSALWLVVDAEGAGTFMGTNSYDVNVVICFCI